MRRDRLRRDIVLAAVVIITLWFYVSSPTSRPTTEMGRLERFMNKGAALSATYGHKSSFDWSKVPSRLNSVPQDPVPQPKPGGLPRVQYHFPAQELRSVAKPRIARLGVVREVFRKNWASYRKYAWKQDALLPISGGAKDQFSGWAATLVDSLDTLWIMGLRAEFDEAVEAVSELDFGQASAPKVNIFETNIRYLGGLLSAYDLSKREVLLTKAIELGNLIYAGFNTASGMPVDFIDFAAAKAGEQLSIEDIVVAASPGTLSLEMTRLSQLTGDPKYYNAMNRVMQLFYRDQNKTELPGIWPMYVSMKKQDVVTGSKFTLGGYEDSLLEYLPKMYQLLGGGDEKYEIMTKAFLRTADEHFLYRPMLPDRNDILMPGNVNIEGGKPVLDPETEHLSCYIGGTFGLSGKLFSRRSDVTLGEKLAHGCAFAYKSFPTGLMPERLNMRPEYKKHLPKGFTTAKDPRYILRPEAIESIFYMYRITGRREYQETAWEMFTSIIKGTETEIANAAVQDVTIAEYPLPKEDYMESFWLAETLKYFFLIFSPADVISLDDWVFNTEAHPFRIPKGKQIHII
ncbi:hypothetical protein NLU13_3413 [Sarocladium strictum]|uniref:alpha-1,2-Mannosidase n=1 Tax=Sarocladium strictum TaxID=5046 RepID=A0AA39LAD7_SARSR|nr:hypothetical protein NLU13_3413 [Sarocladium strictum]